MKYKLNALSDFFAFVGNPKAPHPKASRRCFKNFIFLFLFSITVDFFLDQISMSHWNLSNLKVTNIDARLEELYTDGFWSSFFAIVIIAPLGEELLQRSYLKSFIWNNIFVPINISLVLIFMFQIRGYYLMIICILVLVLGNFIYSTLSKEGKIKKDS